MSLPAIFNNAIFSKHLKSIEIMYETDEDFKALCDKYDTTKYNIEKYKGNTLKNLKVEMEYEELMMELKREILDYLEKRS